jgi:DNA invertase Pin-like site-specific DNA recombinase
MGRLTLNVLLSFAQFERELIGERERVRDKIARPSARASGVRFRSAIAARGGREGADDLPALSRTGLYGSPD